MLEISQVRKDYRDGAKTITAVAINSLTIQAGEQVALAGPSGSGKTTLLHLISGLLTPSSGKIYFEGSVISAMPEPRRDAWRASTVGYVFQKLNLLTGLNVLDNLLLAMSFSGAIPRSRQRQRATDLLAAVGLADRVKSGVRQLSMGEQQRVAIARAVANRPKLILADEPTASLDADNSLAALTLLKQLAREAGSILLLSTHDRQVMNSFDRICRLERAERSVSRHAADGSLA
ncbi:MAG: ABC transporter ATP-binding protein [Sporomusaceae bacterium]|nr:ABC transporter ATP-binding protein [Sporomusaceae bacterium]